MSRFHEVFEQRHAVLPVVHVDTPDQAKAQVRVALEAGADGVFLVDHNARGYDLERATAIVRAEYPKVWLGVNQLGLTPKRSLVSLPHEVDGLWTDRAHEEQSEVLADAWECVLARSRSLLYFGGVAFKYQKQPLYLTGAVLAARGFMDVVTTSGDFTGCPPTLEKLRTIHSAASGVPVALASGVTPENVEGFLPYINAILVATGVSSDFHTFDPVKLKALVAKVRAFRDPTT